MDRGHLDMRKLGELLIAASALPQNHDGLVISATGALSIAARALNDLAAPLDDDLADHELREAHEARVEDVQPRVAAYPLENLAAHFEKLRDAIADGNAHLVSQFFNLYVFD